MEKDSRIYIAGINGMVGAAIKRHLTSEGYTNIFGFSSKELDLRKQADVNDAFDSGGYEYVFLAAAKVGGILANSTYKADFLYDNLMIQANIIEASRLYGVKKLLFLGSSCIYPKDCPQPIKEEYLLTGPLEPTNDTYAIAKIAGIKMCDAYRAQYKSNFISAMPCNLYGPGDTYHLQNSHVIPALIKKFLGGDYVLWGSGRPYREFMHVDDLASACVFLMKNYNDPGHINVGTGCEISITGLAEMILNILGMDDCKIQYDTTKPDGTMRKIMDNTRIMKMGWKPAYTLKQGLTEIIKSQTKI